MTERGTGPEPETHNAPGDAQAPAGRAGQRPLAPGALAALTGRQPIRVVRQPSHTTAALRQKLAEKAAATDELREALDELRQVLDVDTPPPFATGRRGHARVLAVLLALLAVLTLVVYLLLHREGDEIVRSTTPGSADATVASSQSGSASSQSGSASSQSGSASSQSGSASGQATGTAGAPTGGPSATVSVRPLPWPGGAVLLPPGLTTSGPGVTTPGTDVQAALDDDGTHLDVVERVLLDAPVSTPLELAAPSLPALASSQVTDLQVQLGDLAVTPSGGAGASSWTAAPVPGQTYARATLRYRIGSALVTVTPAAPGRSFGVVTPLSALVSRAHGHPVIVRTLDAQVIGVSCPAVEGTGSVCGDRIPGGWAATLPDGAQAIVLLQIQK